MATETVDRTTTASRDQLIAFGLDLVWLMVFVVMGRSTHTEPLSPGGIARTAAPFVIALALTRLVPQVRRGPRSLLAGVIAWIGTIVIAMLMRNLVFGDGTAVSFIIVATAFVGVGFVGWRWIGGVIAKSS